MYEFIEFGSVFSLGYLARIAYVMVVARSQETRMFNKGSLL